MAMSPLSNIITMPSRVNATPHAVSPRPISVGVTSTRGDRWVGGKRLQRGAAAYFVGHLASSLLASCFPLVQVGTGPGHPASAFLTTRRQTGTGSMYRVVVEAGHYCTGVLVFCSAAAGSIGAFLACCKQWRCPSSQTSSTVDHRSFRSELGTLCPLCLPPACLAAFVSLKLKSSQSALAGFRVWASPTEIPDSPCDFL